MNVTNTKSSGSAITSALGFECGGPLCLALAAVELSAAAAAAAAPAVEGICDAGEGALVLALVLGALLARVESGVPPAELDCADVDERDASSSSNASRASSTRLVYQKRRRTCRNPNLVNQFINREMHSTLDKSDSSFWPL